MNKIVIPLSILAGIVLYSTYLAKKSKPSRPSLTIAAKTFSPEPLVSSYSIPSVQDVTYEQIVARGETIPTNMPVIPKQPTIWDGLGDLFAPFKL